MTREDLIDGIARRAPWYQHITFPDFGIATTDDPKHAMIDAAWDNKTDVISLQEAARLRPVPKWNAIQHTIPSVRDLDVLEIGCNCGFFSFEFARAGARSVLGLDVAPKWLENAEWARQILKLHNVRFINCDFMRYDGSENPPVGLLRHTDLFVPLPNQRFDLVFMSTVLDHLFFPLFAIYKMCRIARKWVVIDVPMAPNIQKNEALGRLSVAPDGSHHGFTFSPAFLISYIGRLGIPAGDIQVHCYNSDRNITYIIDVSRLSSALDGA